MATETPKKGAKSSGSGWSEKEIIGLLVQFAPTMSQIKDEHIPAGRSRESTRMLLRRLKQEHKKDGEGSVTPTKRKSDAETGGTNESPSKKRMSRVKEEDN